MPIPYPVYVVDDDPLVRDWTAAMFEEHGLESRSFSSGEEFLSEIDALEPGCVLLDMRMPRRTGLQVQAEIARRRKGLPVIAMTGFADVDVAVRSMKLGAVDFLEKPFPREALLEALDEGFRQLDEKGRA